MFGISRNLGWRLDSYKIRLPSLSIAIGNLLQGLGVRHELFIKNYFYTTNSNQALWTL